MAGWFRKKITTTGDYKGLKMRIGTGLGGKVYVKAGGAAVLTPGAEIYAAGAWRDRRRRMARTP
jgi:TRAP-type mannitol/chloroaromatic compound transport system substrate-binding protein